MRRRIFLSAFLILAILSFCLTALPLSAFAGEAVRDLLVVQGAYDRIEDVLEAIGFGDRVELVPSGAITTTDFTQYSALFINCGSAQLNRPDQELRDKVRDFVHGGGMLYVTDHAANFLMPWDEEMGYNIEYDRGNYGNGNWPATVADPTLRAMFPSDRFNENGDVLIHHSQDNGEQIHDPGRATVLLRNAASGTGFVNGQVQAIDFRPAAGGRVVYTTFHNQRGTPPQPGSANYIPYLNVLTVMEYICGSLGTAPEQEALFSLLDADPSYLIGEPQGGQFSTLSDGWPFYIPEEVTSNELTFALYASTDTAVSSLRPTQQEPVFTLTAPDGQVQEARGDPRLAPVLFHAPRQSGLWTLRCTDPGNVPDGQITTGMALSGRFGASGGGSDEDEDGGGGCDTGFGGMALVLAAAMLVGAAGRGRKH